MEKGITNNMIWQNMVNVFSWKNVYHCKFCNGILTKAYSTKFEHWWSISRVWLHVTVISLRTVLYDVRF